MNTKALSEVLSEFTKVTPNSYDHVLPEKPGFFAVALYKNRDSTDFELIKAAISENIRADAIEYISTNRVDGYPGQLFYYFVIEDSLEKNSEYLRRVLPFCI